jgi:hypothetical protein
MAKEPTPVAKEGWSENEIRLTDCGLPVLAPVANERTRIVSLLRQNSVQLQLPFVVENGASRTRETATCRNPYC